MRRSNASGVGFYNSEPRNFNHGFVRGIRTPFQPSYRRPSPQPPVRGDLFIEAGRLAVEYLVSHGLLSSNVLSGKCQNGSLRHNSKESQDPCSLQEREVSGGRRSPNDQDISRSSNYSRERRRLEASRNHSSDWSQENEREGLSEKATLSRVMEADNEKLHKDIAEDADINVPSSHPANSAAKDDEQSELHDVSKMTSSVQKKDDKEVPKASDGVNTGHVETKDGTGNHDREMETPGDELGNQLCENKNKTSTNDDPDLVNLCPSDIPTTGCSSLISKKNEISEIGRDFMDSKNDDTISGSSGIPSSNEIPGSNHLDTALYDHSFKDTGVSDTAYAVDQQKSVESPSFTDNTFSYEQKSNGLPALELCGSIAVYRGEKRPLEEDNSTEETKRAKQWLSAVRSEPNSQLSDLRDKHSISPGKKAVDIFNVSAAQKSFTDVSLPLKGGVESDIDQGKKQMFSSSFKICDLNLTETSDIHVNHDASALLYPFISSPNNNNVPVNIDLSMRNNCSLTNEYNDSGSLRKDVEMIDLEDASLEEGKSSSTSTRIEEAGITGMMSFPNNPQNSNDNPDGQDGYGFMISELLGHDIPNCSSVQPDMNSLHNDMGLHHGEAMFSDDDPIYMSLGEIPLTGLLRAWEQPTQERNPFEL